MTFQIRSRHERRQRPGGSPSKLTSGREKGGFAPTANLFSAASTTVRSNSQLARDTFLRIQKLKSSCSSRGESPEQATVEGKSIILQPAGDIQFTCRSVKEERREDLWYEGQNKPLLIAWSAAEEGLRNSGDRPNCSPPSHRRLVRSGTIKAKPNCSPSLVASIPTFIPTSASIGRVGQQEPLAAQRTQAKEPSIFLAKVGH